MINLLPPQTKQSLQYARRNSILRRWLTSMILVTLGAVLIIGGGMLYLIQTTKNYEKRAAAAQQSLKDQKIDETQSQIETMSANIKLTTQVLSREILFSKLLKQLATVTPANTNLQQLQIDKLQGALTITYMAKDINSGTQAQINLQDPNNKIFEKADIENINCDTFTPKVYPCTVQIRALFAKNNPFLYISPTGAKQ